MGRRSGRGTRDASVGYKCTSWHVKGSPVAFSLSVTEGTQVRVYPVAFSLSVTEGTQD